MFQNKLINKMLIIILIITLLAIIAFVTINKMEDKTTTGEPTIDDILQHSVDLEEITTNLNSSGYVRVQFKVQTDSKKAQKELIKRDFQIRNAVIHLIASKDKSYFTGGEALINLEEEVNLSINEFMQDGKVVKVYITSFLLQN